MLQFIREQLATAVAINNRALQVMAEATNSYFKKAIDNNKNDIEKALALIP
jgi:hypothetical protein